MNTRELQRWVLTIPLEEAEHLSRQADRTAGRFAFSNNLTTEERKRMNRAAWMAAMELAAITRGALKMPIAYGLDGRHFFLSAEERDAWVREAPDERLRGRKKSR